MRHNPQVYREIQKHMQENIRSGQSNEFRRAQAQYSPLGILMRRKKQMALPTEPKAIWEYEFQRRATKLSFLILTLLYTQDDDVISKKEKKSINKILKTKGRYLNSEDYKEIFKFINDLPDSTYVMKYINENKVNDKTYKSSVSTVRKLVSKDIKYLSILKDLENKYLVEA